MVDLSSNLVSMDGACTLLQLSRQRIYGLIVEGKLHPVKYFNQNFFTVDEINQYNSNYGHSSKKAKVIL